LTSEQPISLTRQLVGRLARPVDDLARTRARLHLLDWLGCVAGARGEAVAAVARAAEPDAMTRAALMGNVLEMDDVDRIGRLHPGPVVWPAAICAVRDEAGRGGAATLADLLDGGVRGYEAMVTVGRMFDDHHYAHWHPTATAGGFGAAAAAASVFGLDAAATVAALGNAGSVAGGLWRMRHEAVMTKAMHAAHAALSALWFARMALHGMTGPEWILEGEQGVFAAMVADPRPVPETPGWRMFEVSFKPWPACRHVHPAIDAALALGPALADGPIRVESYGDALRFCDRPHPATAAEARFSLQHAIAVVATKGRPELADFEPAAIAALAAARARVTVALAADLDATYPAHFGARVTAGGQTALAADALGDPENPVDAAALIAKLRRLVAWGGLPAAEADAAIALTVDADNDAAIAPLLALLERWTA
jgi:2-methylcitrate dehydratase PrpD